MAVKEGDKVYVGINWVCRALGLTEQKQRDRVKKHETLCQGYTKRYTVAKDGRTRLTEMLEIEYLPLWLATINPKTVKPEQKEKLVSYQLKAKDVLANAFIHGNTQANNINNIITQKEVVEWIEHGNTRSMLRNKIN